MEDIILEKNTKITVIGDIHGHIQQFEDILSQINPSKQNIVVFVGDYVNKGWGIETDKKIIRKIKQLVDDGFAYAIQGNHEYKLAKKFKFDDSLKSPELNWACTLPFSFRFVFANGNRLTIVHGGVKPSHTWDDLKNNTDTLFIRTLDENGEYIKLKWVEENGEKFLTAEKKGKPWHEYYDGRFGYIASGHDAQRDGKPKFYAHSCNLDSMCYASGVLTAQIFTEKGRGPILQARGPAASKDKIFRK